MAETKYIVFSLGSQKYGINLDRINGIEQKFNIVPVPVAAPNIKGIIHLRQEVIPIFDLKKRFEITDDAVNMNRELLVMESHSLKFGIDVDMVNGIVPVEEKNIKKIPSVVMVEETSYLENVISTTSLSENGAEEILLTIAIDKLMSDDEFNRVASAMEEVE